MMTLSSVSASASTSEKLKFLSYRSGVLRMLLVTPSTTGRVVLRHGDQMMPLTGAVLEGLFTLKVAVPCQWLRAGSWLYWYIPGRPPMSAAIPAQKCAPHQPAVRVLTQNNQCVIDTGGNTLWRTASELSTWDHASVYQNIYGLLVANPQAFVGHDIHRLHQTVLHCPDLQVLNSLTRIHARQLFKESLKF